MRVSTLGIATAQAQSKDIVLKDEIKGYAVDSRNVVVRKRDWPLLAQRLLAPRWPSRSAIRTW